MKGSKHYRYYVNTAAIKIGSDACEVRWMPAGEIETVVVEQLRQVLRSPEVLAQAVHEVTARGPIRFTNRSNRGVLVRAPVHKSKRPRWGPF